jgi:phasin family protein
MSSTKSKAIADSAAATLDHTKTTIEGAAKSTAEMSQQGFDKTLMAMKEGMEKAAKGLENSQVKMKEGVEKAMKTAEETVSFSQGNIEAMMKASKIYAAGFQDLSKRFAATSKVSLEESVAFSKSLLGVKSLKEAVELQSGFARSSIEKLVAETSQVTDASVKLAEEALAPLTARMSVAVQTFGKAG